MMFNVTALAIGALILAGGLFYLIKEKEDAESRKIYGIVSGIGAVLLTGFAIKTITELL